MVLEELHPVLRLAHADAPFVASVELRGGLCTLGDARERVVEPALCRVLNQPWDVIVVFVVVRHVAHR